MGDGEGEDRQRGGIRSTRRSAGGVDGAPASWGRGGGGVVGEERREGEGRRLSPALGAAITGACHLSPAGAARARNGREAEIPGGNGRAGRLRLGEKKSRELAESFRNTRFCRSALSVLVCRYTEGLTCGVACERYRVILLVYANFNCLGSL